MKKVFFTAIAAVLFFSCQNDQNDQSESVNSETSKIAHRACGSQEVLDAQLRANPALAIKMNEIEAFTQKSILSGETSRLVNGKIVIPVVVNVVYNTDEENISRAQIESQIDVLNEDFNARNADYNNVPALFARVKANVGISFVLDTVNRRKFERESWGQNDDMKRSANGGIDPTSPTTKLNIWVVNEMISDEGLTILGYAQFPGGSAATDGVVLGYKYIGKNGTAQAPYDLGRTATHEVGHWMNLKHIWGDANCGSDLVADTPTHDSYNEGTPVFPHFSTCPGNPVEMTMNYMDYTDDNAVSMFTTGQKNRMAAVFVPRGARASFRR